MIGVVLVKYVVISNMTYSNAAVIFKKLTSVSRIAELERALHRGVN